MQRKSLIRLAVLALASACIAASHAVVTWDESVNGDLSNDRLNPNNFTLVSGVNSILATSVSGDREYFHFHLASGLQLSQIILVAWAGVDQTGFIAVQAGSTFTEPPTGTNVANLLGYTHMGPGVSNLGANILPSMGQGAGSIGFTGPLSGSDYTFWMNQTSPNPETYQLDFVAVPEPASLVALSVGAFAFHRKRRR